MSLRDWKTRDILLLAVLGIVLGAVATLVDYAYVTSGALLGPIVSRSLIGVVMFTALLIPYIVRRPGAALIGMVVVGLVQLPFSPDGIGSLAVNAIYGLFVEIAFLITRYKTYSLRMMILTSIVVGAIGLGVGYIPSGLHEFSIGAQVTVWLLVIGSCILGGWLVTVLAKALVRSGLLNNLLGQTDDGVALS